MYTKTIVLLYFLLSITFICSSQSLIVYKKDPCSNHTFLLKDFMVKKGTATYFPDSITYTVTVPEPGQYYLHTIEELFPIKTEVKAGENTFIYRGNLIQQEIRMHQPPLYSCCGKPCEGAQKDYYENGEIRISGNFTQGRPIDTLTIYSESGLPLKQEIYAGKLVTYSNYDSLGNLLEQTVYSSGEAKTHIEYYMNGRKRRELKFNEEFESITEYFESGAIAVEQNRNKRTEYSSSGTVKKHIRRKKINHLSNFCWEKLLFWQRSYCENFTDFRYRFKQYDEAGNLILDAVTEDYAVDESAFQKRPRDTSWVMRLKYKEKDTWQQEKDFDTKYLGTKHLINIGVN